MAEIVKTYRQSVPATRFIGKKYGDDDRVNGSFGARWHDWFENGWLELLEKSYSGDLKEHHEDGGSYIGLMRDGPDGKFEYWIGIFFPEGTDVPDGFDCVDFPAGYLGVCWIYGAEGEVYMKEGECGEKLQADGYEITLDWCFERYACPRFTTPDDKGNIILDICFYVK